MLDDSSKEAFQERRSAPLQSQPAENSAADASSKRRSLEGELAKAAEKISYVAAKKASVSETSSALRVW
jgi:hypothetical protein